MDLLINRNYNEVYTVISNGLIDTNGIEVIYAS